MKLIRLSLLCSLLAIAAILPSAKSAAADPPWAVLEGKEGPGKGKHIVLISGDQEYRSEEALPQLAKILSNRHGFKCTVLFTVDPKTGTINPNISNVPGLEALKTADLMIIFTRFLKLPDDQMQQIADYLAAGKPVIGMRTATHAFNGISGPFAKFNDGSNVKGWEGGFGTHILGERWVNHHGNHGKEGTRGIVAKGQENHPILKGFKPGDIFGTTDVYTVHLPLPGNSAPLVLGEVTETLMPDSKAVTGKKNDPMMPVAWTRTYEGDMGKTGRVFTTTMGASQDLNFEGTRRMLVNAAYWATGLEDKIPEKTNVGLVGDYKPTPFHFKSDKDFRPGMTPVEACK